MSPLPETVTLAQSSSGNPVLNITVFIAFIAVTLFVVFRVGRTTSKAADFYTGGARFSGRQNGLAIAGDYLSAASFLGIVGGVALTGYDGFLYAVGFFVAWLLALLLVAEPLRNTGRFTMADVLSFRLRQRPVRIAAALATLFVSLFYLIAQMAGAGALVSVLLDIHGSAAQAVVIGVVGVMMTAYVLIGGMKGTTYVQMIKAILLCSGVIIMTVIILAMVRGNVSELLQLAVEKHGGNEAILSPGVKYGATTATKLDFISLGISLTLGVAGLPHVLMRFYTVPTAREARKSVTWAIVLIGGFYLLTLILGYAAAAFVGPDRIKAAPGGANAAAPLLALELAGPIFMALISAVAFATVLAVVAGLAITASASVAHDVYDAVLRHGKASEEEQVRVSRITVVVIGVAATALGIAAMHQNVAFLVSLAFCIAASANLPTILFSLFWRRFTTTVAVASMTVGLVSALVLIVFSPAVSGSPTSILPSVDFAWFPLTNPGLVTIPLGFLAAVVGTFVGPRDNLDDKRTEMEVRSVTGVGVEAPVAH
ncbi:cation acetate symporter [Corynebacterium bovis]|uniref:solute symporter family protein n=1 Tax=Corynebacterium bovis TaxID=36808 RepID=UPI0031392980